MSGQQLLKKFSLSAGLNLLVKLFWVLQIEVSIQNILGTEAYGAYFEAFQYSFLFYILLDLGISNYNTRLLAGQEGDIKQSFPLLLGLKVFLGLIYLMVLISAAWFFNYDSDKLMLILFTGFNQVLLSMSLFLRSNISGLHLYNTDSLLSVLDRLLMGLMGALIIWLVIPQNLFSFTIYDFALLQGIGYFLAIIFAFAVVYKNGAGRGIDFSFSQFMPILKKSYPFAILFTLMTLYTRIDAVMLAKLSANGDFQNGLYASAFRLLDAALIFSVLLSNLLLPMLSKLLATQSSIREVTQTGFYLTLMASFVFSSVCYVFASELYSSMYDHHQDVGSTIFKMLMLNFIPMSFGYIFGTALTAGGQLKILNMISAFGVLMNVILNFWLIPNYEAMGAVWATLITQCMITLCSFFFALKYFKLPLYDLVNWRVLLFVFITLLSSWSVYHYFRYEAPWQLLLPLVVLFQLLAGWFLGMVKLKSILSRD